MVSIGWCIRQRRGIRLVQPDAWMADAYMRMSEESLALIGKVASSRLWSATITYYAYHYALYALMLRLGVRSGMHACSIEFMRKHLIPPYTGKDMEMVERAFSARMDLQYYIERPVDDALLRLTQERCGGFCARTKSIISRIRGSEIERVRSRLRAEA